MSSVVLSVLGVSILSAFMFVGLITFFVLALLVLASAIFDFIAREDDK